MENIQNFINRLSPVERLIPRVVGGNKIAQPVWTKQVVTIAGVKTVTNRFLPVSHEGYSNETYVDKVEILGRTRAEFISRKMKGIERRMHMALFRELAEKHGKSETWQAFWEKHFGTVGVIPDGLNLADWNSSLFGGLDAKGQMATFSRIRYFDAFSVEDTADCVGSADSEEMGIGNQVYEDLVADREGQSRKRGSETYHLYEYVKAGTRFPFITMIESPALLDVSGMLRTILRADAHGYGKYSANHGKFSTEILVVAIGYPRFSVLDMLTQADSSAGKQFLPENLQFDAVGESVVLKDIEIDEIARNLEDAFAVYVEALG